MTKRLIASLLAAGAAFAASAAPDVAVGTDAADQMAVGEPVVSKTVELRPGVTLKRLVFEKPRPMAAYVARVDLATPGVGFTATERDPLYGEPMPDFTNETWLVNTKRETTADFMTRRRGEGMNVEIAFNTSGFRPWGGAGCYCDYAAFYRWTLADGVEISHGLEPGMGTYFVVRKDGSAFIRSVVKPHMTNDWAFAVYGNRALLEGGRRAKAAVRPPDDGSGKRKGGEPRTALGLSADGKMLVVLAVDGRQPGYSEGASCADLADILLTEGCTDAVNMDGGGSTSLVVWDRENTRPRMLNRHANGYMRKVGLNLGITFPVAEEGRQGGAGTVADFLAKSAEERIAILADPVEKAKFRHVVPRPKDGPPRFMEVDGVSNMRDIGGWTGLDGRRVRHGLAYRSAAFDTGVRFRRGGRENYEYLFGLSPVTEEEKADFMPSERTITDKGVDELVNGLGVKSDLDLRSPHECYGMKSSPLGAGVKWFHCPQLTYGNFGKEESRRAFAKAFRVFLDESNYPVVFHCAGGADRTGAIAFMLNGVCGVSLDDLRKDWELTVFGTSHAENPGFTHEKRFDRLVAVVEKEPGGTLAEKIASFVKSCGFTDADIDRVREIMLEPKASDYPRSLPAITDVAVTGGFWLPRVETNRLVTIWSDFGQCEKSRIPNFTNAAARAWGTFRGIPYDDSDVYKVIEGAAYAMATHPDERLRAYVENLIGWIAGAQEPDGYIYTARTLGHWGNALKKGLKNWNNRMMGPVRWSDCANSHELYNAGHLYEAAVAWHAATGSKSLLDVAVKSADLVERTFGPGETQLKDVPGHEEIELALCRLYRATGDGRYLALARHFIDRRGRGGAPDAHIQNHLPVLEQREAVGHAVRAVYLYCGMADVAALTGDGRYVEAIDALWENVVTKKLALNGSVGARRRGEAFGADYDLPNEGAYNETCAGIGNALWNVRLFLMHGDAKYVDVLERALYNGILSGVSLSGDEFFYPNPLASKGGYKRRKWFGTPCCPVNVARFLPQVGRFAYAVRGNDAFVNLFIESDATLRLDCGDVRLSQKTDYPWNGEVRIAVTPPKDGAKFALNVRVPGWCVGCPVPSDLYAQTAPGTAADFKAKVNGRDAGGTRTSSGYFVIDREWTAGDIVEVAMDMPVRRIKAHDAVKSDRGRLAVERGPVVYCAEGADNDGKAFGAEIPADAEFAEGEIFVGDRSFPSLKASNGVTLVPYCVWGNRDPGNEMQTWFKAE